MKPIDDVSRPARGPTTTPEGKPTVDYLTWDIVSELYRAIDAKVERTARERGITLREAARIVLESL